MVLGIDASISSTGYAVVDNDKFNTVADFGKIVTKKNNKIETHLDEDCRICHITDTLSKIIDNNIVTIAVME